MTAFFTTSCFVPTQVNSSISQSRKKMPAKLWRHQRKLTFAMLERTLSTTRIKSQQRRMRYSMKQVLGSSAGREIIIPSEETDLFWIRDPCTVHLKIPVLFGCPQNTTISWLIHHGTITEMQSRDDWGPDSKEKYGRLWFETAAQYCIIQMLIYTPKSTFFTTAGRRKMLDPF